MAFLGMEWIIVIIAIIIFLFLGAKKIPEFARNLGKAKAEFQRGSMEVERQIREEERADREREERRKAEEARKRAEEERRAAEAEKAEEEKAEDEEAEDEEGDDELREEARELGIDPAGKTDEELRILVDHKKQDQAA